jgi:signal transduction histidine kinase
MRRSPRGRLRRAADVAIPLLVGLFLASLIEDGSLGRPPALTVLGMLAGVAQGAALWWRRSHPALVMAVALAGGLVVQVLAPDGIFPYAGLVAIGSLAAARPPRVSLPALAALLALTALNFATASREDTLFAMAFPVVAWALGEATRNRRVAIAEESRRAVSEEQARIARELHDVIAHSVSVIVVQAAAADDVFDQRPDQARAALRSIESAGRDALGELRHLLAVVRPETAGGPPQAALAQPALAQPALPQPGLARSRLAQSALAQPGLAQLAELAEPLRAAGLEVAVRREGAEAAGPLPAAVDLSAYRIVQEALTNTLRHSGARRAEVTVWTGPGMLELNIRDDGRGSAAGPAGATAGGPGGGISAGGGRGIAGMRERATMLGGTLDAGPVPEGGFRVHARLPLEPVL